MMGNVLFPRKYLVDIINWFLFEGTGVSDSILIVGKRICFNTF